MDDFFQEMRNMEKRMQAEMEEMDKMMDDYFRQDRDTLDEFFYLSNLGAFATPPSRQRLVQGRIMGKEEERQRRSHQIKASFHDAVRQGDAKKVGSLLSHQLVGKINSPYTVGGHETNALIDACSRGHLEISRLLIAHGADVNQRVGSQTPLYVAAKNGHSEIVGLLLEKGAEVEPRMGTRRNSAVAELPGGSLFRDTPLHVAIRQHHHDIINALLGSGASFLSPDYAGETPKSLLLRWASSEEI